MSYDLSKEVEDTYKSLVLWDAVMCKQIWCIDKWQWTFEDYYLLELQECCTVAHAPTGVLSDCVA